MKRNLLGAINIFATTMSAGEWAWRLATILIIGGGGATTGLLASESPYFQQFGGVLWAFIGLIGAGCVAIIFYLVRAAQNQMAMAEYTRSVSQPKSRINPLLDNFQDLIIPVEELRVPGVQVHAFKHFKRCHFVGPAAIAIMGCKMVNSEFIECGDIIPVPLNTTLTGIVVLSDCTIEASKFYRTTIMVVATEATAFSEAVSGTSVAGA